jgi:putative nucleotidyltransferase-like protein
MARTVTGATVTIELHHELLARTPFVAGAYEDLIDGARALDWDGVACQTLGCEDMLWHVYAHAFVINTTTQVSVSRR